MTKLKRLKQALSDIPKRSVRLCDWLKDQPGSTRRGVQRGNFQIPKYVHN